MSSEYSDYFEFRNRQRFESTVVLRADEIEKRYGAHLPFSRAVEVLTDASLDVRTGEIVGIVGENGSGNRRSYRHSSVQSRSITLVPAHPAEIALATLHAATIYGVVGTLVSILVARVRR